MDFLPNQGLIDSVKYHEAGGKKAIEKAYKHSNENQYTIGFGTSYLYAGLENGFKPFMRTIKAKDKDLDAKIYYMARNIRNTKTNKKHNRKRFEAWNYPPEQLSLF